jgi:o-succinylbenzoate synthase
MNDVALNPSPAEKFGTVESNPVFQLESIQLREIELQLKAAFETSFGVTTRRRILIVRVFDKSGAIGYGECTAMEEPFFNHETIDTAWMIISKFVTPMLASASVTSAKDVGTSLRAIQGNRMAIGAVETAIWDLEAKLLAQPLWRHLGGTKNIIGCGVSIGLQKSVELLLEKVAREVESGYQRIKIKIKPGQDIELVKAVRKEFPAITLSVDANSAYSLERDADLLRELDDCNLLMIEQPLSAGDFVDHAKLQRQLKTAICLDESITSLRDARHALELGACRIINIKLGRVGGHASARAIQEYARLNSIPVWCGGMLESGIGRAHNIAMSTQDGFTLPGDVSASARYWVKDIIEPPVTVTSVGSINAPLSPGIGYEVDEEYIEALTKRSEEIFLNIS